MKIEETAPTKRFLSTVAQALRSSYSVVGNVGPKLDTRFWIHVSAEGEAFFGAKRRRERGELAARWLPSGELAI